MNRSLMFSALFSILLLIFIFFTPCHSDALEIPTFESHPSNPLINNCRLYGVTEVKKYGTTEYRAFVVKQNSECNYPEDVNVDLLTSNDGINWSETKSGILNQNISGHTFNYRVVELKENGIYKAWHDATSDWCISYPDIFYSESQDGLNYNKKLTTLSITESYESRSMRVMSIVKANGIYYLFYHATIGGNCNDYSSTGVALATSTDGKTNWTKHGIILSPMYGHPRIIFDNGQFEAFAMKDVNSVNVPFYMVSSDGISWTDVGQINTLPNNISGISGVVKEDGKYSVWFYTADKTFNLATSNDDCTYGISPSSGDFTKNGGTSSISVTASSTSCAWTASESLDWVTVSPTSGIGNGTVKITVGANIGFTRFGSVTVAGKAYIVTQADIPAIPTLSSPAGNANAPGTSVNLSWSASPGATQYWLWARRTSDNVVIFNQNVGNSTSYALTGLPNNGSDYFWMVRAGNSGGWSKWTPAGRFFNGTADIPAPPTLSSPAANANAPGSSVNLSWSASTGATQYWLWVRRTSDKVVIFNQNVGNLTSYTLTGLPNNGSDYFWMVRAGNSGGWSKWTAAGRFYNGTAAIPAIPTLSSPVANANVAGTSVNLSWSVSTGATQYWLWARRTSDKVVIFNQSIGNRTSYALTGLPNNGSDYFWMVRAGNSGGWSKWTPAGRFFNGGTCTLNISPSNGSFAANGGTGSISVTASSSNCVWTTSNSLSWATLSPTSGTGSKTVTITVTPNTGTARSGLITIAGKTYTISQNPNNSSIIGIYVGTTITGKGGEMFQVKFFNGGILETTTFFGRCKGYYTFSNGSFSGSVTDPYDGEIISLKGTLKGDNILGTFWTSFGDVGSFYGSRL